MFFKKKISKEVEVYHPSKLGPSDKWLLCHVILGAKKVTELSDPSRFSRELCPEWYRELPESKLEMTWDAQEKYTRRILQWINGIGIVDAFISGAEEDRERLLGKDYDLPVEGHFAWSNGLIDVLPRLNIYNLYLRAKDGSEFIIYESETETVFVRDCNNTFPEKLRSPQISLKDLT